MLSSRGRSTRSPQRTQWRETRRSNSGGGEQRVVGAELRTDHALAGLPLLDRVRFVDAATRLYGDP